MDSPAVTDFMKDKDNDLIDNGSNVEVEISKIVNSLNDTILNSIKDKNLLDHETKAKSKTNEIMNFIKDRNLLDHDYNMVKTEPADEGSKVVCETKSNPHETNLKNAVPTSIEALNKMISQAIIATIEETLPAALTTVLATHIPRQDLTCKICFDSYTTTGLHRPRVLPCGHSLCGVCASMLLVEENILCPICQQSYKYQDLDKITINCELENVIERLAYVSSTELKSGNSNPAAIPKDISKPTGPKLHYGICKEHEIYKVHHCLTHDIFICSDCVIAYHLEKECRHVPVEKFLKDKKADLYNKIDSHMSSLQEKSKQIEQYNCLLTDTELQIKTKIEKLQSDIKALTQQLSICQKSISKYTELMKECKDWQEKAQFSKYNAQGITTLQELNDETQLIKSSECKTQEITEQVKDILKQFYGAILTSGSFASLVTCEDVYATYTHEDKQRWGRILAEDDKYNLLLQDFKSIKPPNWALVIELSDVTEHLSFPRHVYLCFSNKGMSLGQVVIKVNEDTPRRAQQLVDLCVGQTGERWSGSTDISMNNHGMKDENLTIYCYLNANDETCDGNIFSDLENPVLTAQKKGLVVSCDDNTTFRIFTSRSFKGGNCNGVVIGEVVSGLDVVQKIISDNLVAKDSFGNQQLGILESGLVIDSS